jgi:hypothetical protein
MDIVKPVLVSVVILKLELRNIIYTNSGDNVLSLMEL